MVRNTHKVSHHRRKPTNALLSRAVEICEQDRMTHLVYGKFVYTDEKSSLTEFKRRSGFEKVSFPRYYVPLTWKGKLAFRLGMHRGVTGMLPVALTHQLLGIRAWLYGLRHRTPVPDEIPLHSAAAEPPVLSVDPAPPRRPLKGRAARR